MMMGSIWGLCRDHGRRLWWLTAAVAVITVAAAPPAGAQSDPAPAGDGTAVSGVADDNAVTNGAPADGAERIAGAAFHFARAKLLADEGAFDEALEAYRTALEIDSSDPYSQIEVARFHSYLAQISRNGNQRLEHLEAAAAYVDEARAMVPDNIEILRNYAQVHMRLGEQQTESLEKARQAFEQLRSKTEGDLQVLTSLGQIYLWKRDFPAAVEVLQESARYRPGHPMVQAMLADALRGAGEGEEAEVVLRRILELRPDSLEHRISLAELLAQAGRHQAALEVLRAAPAEQLGHPQLRQTLARQLIQNGRAAETLEIVDALAEQYPGMADVERLRVAALASLARYDEAIEALEPLVRQGRDNQRRLTDGLQLSLLLERAGRGRQAVAELRELIDQQPESVRPQLRLRLIGMLSRQGETEQAIGRMAKELERAAAEDKPLYARLLSEMLAASGQTDEAIEVLDQSISAAGETSDPEIVDRLRLERLDVLAAAERWPALAGEARSLFDAGDEVALAARLTYATALARDERLDEALAFLESADPDGSATSPYAVQRAELLLEAERVDDAERLIAAMVEGDATEDLFLAAQIYQRAERFRDSIPLLERVAEVEPDSLRALFLLGAAHERSGDLEAAAAAFHRVLELSPQHAQTLNYLGYMWAENGQRLDEALDLILRAVAIEPENGAFVDSLGWVYFQLGRYREARLHLERAARLVDDDATVQEHLGDVYVAVEELDLAREAYLRARRLGGDDPGSLERKIEALDR